MTKTPIIRNTILTLLAAGGGCAGEPVPSPADPALYLLPSAGTEAGIRVAELAIEDGPRFA